MTSKIIIIGNASDEYHLGSILVRSAKEINVSFGLCDTNVNIYAPSMKELWGKIFYRLAGKRPLEWFSFNKEILESIDKIRPQLVLIAGIFPLHDQIFYFCNKKGIKIVNYLTDSPWSKQNYHPIYRSNLNKYDCIFSTKKLLIPDLIKIGAKQVNFLPFAFDPFLHHQLSTAEIESENAIIFDVCLIGGADSDRISFISNFLTTFKGKFGLYGGYWNKNKKLQQYNQGVVLGDAYIRAIYSCKINIGVVRRANKDGHSMRTYEIPACGGVGIYEDTSEHREIFNGYPEYGFFTSPNDLADKCNWLIEHPTEREQMRQLGIRLVVKESNTYTSRLKEILEISSFEGG